MNTLIDDRSRPTLRQHIGSLLANCQRADIAVGHVRLAVLDLDERETRGVAYARILIGRLEVRSLTDFGADEADTTRLDALVRFLTSGRVEVRSAGMGAWAPDFSIYRGGTTGAACLIGPHWFREPVAVSGPAFTTLLTDPAAVALALGRFETLWKRSHDVLEPVLGAIARRQSFDAE